MTFTAYEHNYLSAPNRIKQIELPKQDDKWFNLKAPAAECHINKQWISMKEERKLCRGQKMKLKFRAREYQWVQLSNISPHPSFAQTDKAVEMLKAA